MTQPKSVQTSSNRPQPYWWFQGEAVDELTRQLVAAPGARLEVRVDSQNRMMLFVLAAGDVTTAEGGGINKSHVCPPDCG